MKAWNQGSILDIFDMTQALRRRQVGIWMCELELRGEGGQGSETDKFGVAGM